MIWPTMAPRTSPSLSHRKNAPISTTPIPAATASPLNTALGGYRKNNMPNPTTGETAKGCLAEALSTMATRPAAIQPGCGPRVSK